METPLMTDAEDELLRARAVREYVLAKLETNSDTISKLINARIKKLLGEPANIEK